MRAVYECPSKKFLKAIVWFSRVWRTTLIAAAAVACVFAIMVTVQATGADVFGAMARWTKDVFSFGQISPDSQVSDDPAQETSGQETQPPSPGPNFASLQEAFDAYGMTEVHEPNWPAFYTDGEGFVSVGIMSYEGEPATQVQKTNG